MVRSKGAEAAYYAKVLRAYGEVVGLRDVRVDGKPTGEINRKRINALGFPAGLSPQETRNAVVAWGRFHMGTWGRSDLARAALRSAMAAYVGDTVEPNREPRNLRTEQGSQPSVRLSPTHERDSAEILSPTIGNDGAIPGVCDLQPRRDPVLGAELLAP